MSIFLVALCILNAFTCDLLIKVCVHLKLTSYNQIAEKAFGKWMSTFVDILTIVSGVGSLIAYMVLVGDFGCSIMDAVSSNCSRPLMVYILGLVTIFPLSLLHSLNSLRFLSFVSLAFIFAFCVVVVVLSIMSIV